MDLNAPILVVDDLDPMRKVLAGNLKSLGYNNVTTARNASDAIQILKTQPIALVMTDWNMPEMSGLELLRWIRQESLKHKFTPVIMVTAEVQRQQVADAISSGTTDFVLKPFTLKTLNERIQSALSGKSLKPPAIEIKKALVSEKPEKPEPFKKAVEKDDRLTLLAVDAAAANLKLITNIFQNDYHVKTALSGEEAIKICEGDAPPELILLDIMMPDMGGFEVLRLLKANEGTSEIPVILMTDLDDEKSIVRGLEAGAIDYIAKPVGAAILKARVNNLLRFHRGHEELKHTLDVMLENAKLLEDVEHIVRHDMRGPLSVISGVISSAVADKKISQEQLKVIEDSAYSLQHMLNLSTDMYKMERRQFVLFVKPFDITRLVHRVTEEIRWAFTSKNIEFNIEILPPDGTQSIFVSGDELLTYSLLHNLIKNAAEASPDKGVITLTVLNETQVKIAIHNYGVVPEPIRGRFFEKFATMGKEKGTGLGTYSARLITEAQNGTIAMKSSEEEGTTIAIALPAA